VQAAPEVDGAVGVRTGGGEQVSGGDVCGHGVSL
jgi:hypothetical protein